MGILKPIEVVVAWIMVAIHDGLRAVGMDANSGLTWALSIVGLTVVIRILLIPLFVRQINASRSMQLLQPQLMALQKKYKGKTDQASREAMAREQFALYREHGTNPLSSCLPLLIQSPIFFALFRVLNNLGKIASGKHETIGPINREVAGSIEHSTFFFGSHLSDTFHTSGGNVKMLCLVMIVLMSAATFYSQRMLMTKNMPASTLESNPFIQQQKIMLYVFPLIFAVSGVSFPIGVLIYWLTSNIWAAGQQFYVIHRMPAPGSQAEREMNERRARRGKAPKVHQTKKRPAAAAEGEVIAGEVIEKPKPTGGQRQQPRRRDRNRGPKRPDGQNGPTNSDDSGGSTAIGEA